MLRSRLSILAFTLALSVTSAHAQSQAAADRPADAAAIRAHIGSIFQAFIDWDVEKIRATHSEDWRGLLEGSATPIKGIDEYMRANGIDWPLPPNAPKPVPSPDPTRGYEMKDFDVIFYSPVLAVANFIGEFNRKTGSTTVVTRRFHIMDVYEKRQGNWIQVASHTVIDPDWRAEQMVQPFNVGPEMRKQILAERDKVWQAYFTNDRATLERMIPDEAIAMDDGSTEWSNKASILAGAKSFVDNGGKLLKLEFPKTELQVYGNTVIVYTTFLYEIETGGKRISRSGRGTEMFVRRGKELVNVGWHLDDGQ